MSTFIWAVALSTVFSRFIRSFTSAGKGVFWGRERRRRDGIEEGGEGKEEGERGGERMKRGGRGEEEGEAQREKERRKGKDKEGGKEERGEGE